MKKVIVSVLCFLCCFFVTSAFPAYSEGSSSKDALPTGFSTVKLGMSLDDVKSALASDSQFGYRGDRDVSMLPGDDRTLIETDAAMTPGSFLDRCWFQFYDGKLYIITINMRSDRIDYYSIFSKLMGKYGDPASLTPEKSVWQNDSVIMSLERPLTLKYVDAQTFNKLVNDSQVQKSGTEMSRDSFLKGL